MKILLVDDQPDILEILSLALEAMGNHNVFTALSGNEALQLIAEAETPFDVFLFDIQMPNMTGIELCEKVREQYQYEPIIMITAMADQKRVDAAFNAGATDYVTKPVDFMDLKHRLSLAEKMSFMAKQLAKKNEQVSQTSPELVTNVTFDLGEAIPIDNIDGVLRVYAFENYLMQLTKMQLFHTRVFILSVKNIQAIYSRCTGQEFVDEVTDIAEGISDSLDGHFPLIAYFGSGLFGIAVGNQFINSINVLTSDVSVAIETLGMVFRNGDPVEVQFELAEIQKESIRSFTDPQAFAKTMTQQLRSIAATTDTFVA